MDTMYLRPENWSPTTRLVVGLAGTGLLAYGFTQRAPWACVLGTVGLGLMATATRGEGLRDLLPDQATDWLLSQEHTTRGSAPLPQERAEVGAPYAAGF